jgi:hypothetical protein
MPCIHITSTISGHDGDRLFLEAKNKDRVSGYKLTRCAMKSSSRSLRVVAAAGVLPQQRGLLDPPLRSQELP